MNFRESHGPFIMTIVLACTVGFDGAIEAKKLPVSRDKIAHAILLVKDGSTIEMRAKGAQQLSNLTQAMDTSKIDDKTVADIVSLLNTSEDPVRFWIAGCIEDIGPRARAAVPRLREVLAEVECLHFSLTSESIVRHALVRLGEPEPPAANCSKAK